MSKTLRKPVLLLTGEKKSNKRKETFYITHSHNKWNWWSTAPVSILTGNSSKGDDDDNDNAKKQLVLWAKQQLWTCITHFCTFLWRPLQQYDVRPPNATFLWRTWTNDGKFFFLFFLLGKVLKNSTPGGIAYIWQIELVQIDAIKFERAQIYFLATSSSLSTSSLQWILIAATPLPHDNATCGFRFPSLSGYKLLLQFLQCVYLPARWLQRWFQPSIKTDDYE